MTGYVGNLQTHHQSQRQHRAGASLRQVRVSYEETEPLQDGTSGRKDLRVIKVRKSPTRRSRVQPAAGTPSRDGSQHHNRSASRRQMCERQDGGVEQPSSRRSSGKERNLRVVTSIDDQRMQDQTPRIDSTLSRRIPANIRGSSDLRSPGARKTPVAAMANMPSGSSATIPDFITQTDANGNATTPRSADAIQKAGRRGHTHGGSKVTRNGGNRNNGGLSPSGNDLQSDDSSTEEDPCESLLDTFRLMCCCLLTDSVTAARFIKDSPTQDISVESPDNASILGSIHPDDIGKKCLVLDLDETLVHSSFRAVPGADFVIPVQIEDVVHFVYVMKRPGVDEFLVEMAKHYEIVIYTASLNKYADPLLDLLDPHKTIRYRLFRESCVFHEGNYVKDLSLLGRDLSQTIIIDNSPNSYLFHPENAIDCSSFIDDPKDRELDQIGGFLASIKDIGDVRGRCCEWKNWNTGSTDVSQE